MHNFKYKNNPAVDTKNSKEIFQLADEFNVSIQELLDTMKIVGSDREVISKYINAKQQPFLQIKRPGNY